VQRRPDGTRATLRLVPRWRWRARAWTKAEVATTGVKEAVVERGNLKLAYQRVVENRGAAGVDALT